MRRKVLITSAIPYVNNVPHLGNLIGSTLSADVFARYCRSRGYETLYVCGTDEHGTATEVQAKREGVTPRELCDKYFALHKQIYEWFALSFDIFGRTSDASHVPYTQHIFSQLEKNGFILEQETEQLYSDRDGMFLADRYVLGTCPHCAYADARGDQCDKCGRLLTPLELIEPRSALSGDRPMLRKTKHLFLDLLALEPQIRAWLEGKKFSENTLRTTAAWMAQGLKPRSITRDLSWGVPVPRPGYEKKVFYVWFDAPIGYISMTSKVHSPQGAGRDAVEYWWKDPQVQLYQFMGKDNIPFHSVIFPGMLLGTNEGWTTVHHINTTEFLNYEDTKFSKSRGVGIFADDAMHLGVPADVFRYYLLTNRPETADTAFTWADFQSKLNNELVANLGNLVNRTLSFLNQFYDGIIPAYEPRDADTAFWAEVNNSIARITQELEGVQLKDALHSVMRLSSLGNQFFHQHEPWRARKENPPSAAATLATLANFLVDLAVVLEPFLPHTAAAICQQLNCALPPWSALSSKEDALKAGHRIKTNSILFTKVEDKQVQLWKAQFSGTQNKRAQAPAEQNDVSAFERVQLVVGKIEHVERHPNADKLFVEKVNMGEKLGVRTIVSGLAQHYTPEQLLGKHIVVVANLVPAKLRGVESQGMLLAAQDENGAVGIVTTQAPIGTVVTHGQTKHLHTPITVDVFAQVPLVSNGDTVLHDGKPLSGGSFELHIDKGVRGIVR